MDPNPKAPKSYYSIVSQLEVRLSSNDRSEKKLERVNYFQDSLAFIAIQAYRNPDFFTEQVIEDIYNLLKQAGDYLQGTMYEGRALKRPDEFRGAVEAMKRAAEARQRVSAEYNSPLRRGA